MTFSPNPHFPSGITEYLECCVQTALELGELSPGMEAQIAHLLTCDHLSPQDQSLLNLLRDAIVEGCICRVQDAALQEYGSDGLAAFHQWLELNGGAELEKQSCFRNS